MVQYKNNLNETSGTLDLEGPLKQELSFIENNKNK